jgi:DNA repair protein RecO (recombination protein O)
MTTDALNAWVVHKSWSGETSARVVFFTKEQGLVSCFYKGGRLPKNQALLQLFSPLWLSLNVRGDACFVRHLELAAAPLQLPTHSLFAGLYVNELIYHALKPHDSQECLHDAYESTLNALKAVLDKPSLEGVLRRFEWSLLSTCGYALSFSHEALTGAPILDDRFYRLIDGEGFVVAEEGFLGKHLILLSQGDLNHPDLLRVAKAVMRRAIQYALDGKKINSRDLYRKT